MGAFPSFNLRRVSLACSITLHAGLLGWIIWPRTSVDIPPRQQVVDVSVVRVSASALPSETVPSQQVKTAPAAAVEPLPEPTSEAMVVLQKPVQKLDKPAKPEPQLERQIAAAPSTTGKQSPDATRNIAAITRPVFDAVSLHNQPPAYPDEARRRGIEGMVTLEVDVTQLGAAQEVTVIHSSGYALLDRAAYDAIRGWRFIPAYLGDQIVDAKVNVPVEFKLD